MHKPNIFFKVNKCQKQHIIDKSFLCLRKLAGKHPSLTAKDLENKETVNNIINFDQGYRVLRELRGSPPYWEKCKKKDLFSMLRQLGKPTWFASFSSADTRWIHLLQILGHIVDGQDDR